MTANWRNRTLWTGDNLAVMRGMNSESVDLLYLDPPFNSNRDYAAPIGSEAAGAAFKDTWSLSDVDQAWHGEIADRQPALYAIIDAAGVAHGKGMKSYLIMMAVRLLEMKRLLKPTGSIYLHCDPTASHYLKMLMDSIFGSRNYRNEIVWCYRGPGSPKMRQFNRKHDVIHWYSGGGVRGHLMQMQCAFLIMPKQKQTTGKVCWDQDMPTLLCGQERCQNLGGLKKKAMDSPLLQNRKNNILVIQRKNRTPCLTALSAPVATPAI